MARKTETDDKTIEKKRYQIGYEPSWMIAWRAAAAHSGLQLFEWVERTLNAEARTPTHVPPLPRGAAPSSRRGG